MRSRLQADRESRRTQMVKPCILPWLSLSCVAPAPDLRPPVFVARPRMRARAATARESTHRSSLNRGGRLRQPEHHAWSSASNLPRIPPCTHTRLRVVRNKGVKSSRPHMRGLCSSRQPTRAGRRSLAAKQQEPRAVRHAVSFCYTRPSKNTRYGHCSALWRGMSIVSGKVR